MRNGARAGCIMRRRGGEGARLLCCGVCFLHLGDPGAVAQQCAGEAQRAPRGGTVASHGVECGGCAQLTCQEPNLAAPRAPQPPHARRAPIPSVAPAPICQIPVAIAQFLRLPNQRTSLSPVRAPVQCPVVAVRRGAPEPCQVPVSHVAFSKAGRWDVPSIPNMRPVFCGSVAGM